MTLRWSTAGASEGCARMFLRAVWSSGLGNTRKRGRVFGNIRSGLRLPASGFRLPADDKMTYVDSAVLDLTERMCRLFQAWTGRTNVWLAFQLTNLSIVVYFTWAAGLYLVSGDLALRIFVAAFCGGVFFVLTRTIFKVSIEASETAAYRRLAQGLRNPRRLRDAQLRIAFLTLSIVLSYPLWLAYVTLHQRLILLTEALIILTTVVLYVLACDPLPPCAGKVTAWLRGMVPARTASGVEIQTP
jgi:hypothetical protein